MNILIVSHFAGSQEHGMVFRNYAMAREWVRQGHQVTIVACAYSHFRQKQPVMRGRVQQEMLDGIRYVWVWGPRYSQASSLGRVTSMATFTLQCLVLPLPLDEHCDVVVCSSPHPFAIYPAARLARRFGARLIYDIRDLWPLTPVLLGNYSPRHPFIRLLQAAEDYACRHADLVTAVPRNAEAYLRGRGLAAGRFLPVSNGAFLDDAPADPLPHAHVELLRGLRQAGGFVIGYAGTLGVANAMDGAITAISRCPANIHLVMLGDGGSRAALDEQARALGCLDRVHFLAPVGRRQVKEFLANVDVGYVGGRRSPLYEYGASVTKLNDYMLARLPILYAVGDPENAVELSGAGFSCAPDDLDQQAALMQRLAQMTPSELSTLGTTGYRWCVENQLVSTQASLVLTTLQATPRRH